MPIREEHQDITPWERAIAERWLHVLASLLEEGNKDAQSIALAVDKMVTMRPFPTVHPTQGDKS